MAAIILGLNTGSPRICLSAKIKVLVCYKHISLWSLMRALFRYAFHRCSAQVLGIVTAQGRWAMLDNTHGKDSGAFRCGLFHSHNHGAYF